MTLTVPECSQAADLVVVAQLFALYNPLCWLQSPLMRKLSLLRCLPAFSLNAFPLFSAKMSSQDTADHVIDGSTMEGTGARQRDKLRLLRCTQRLHPATVCLFANTCSGGGQVLRNCVALAALTSKKIRVVNIRANRSSPGLRAQHLEGIKYVAALHQAGLTGAEVVLTNRRGSSSHAHTPTNALHSQHLLLVHCYVEAFVAPFDFSDLRPHDILFKPSDSG